MPWLLLQLMPASNAAPWWAFPYSYARQGVGPSPPGPRSPFPQESAMPGPVVWQQQPLLLLLRKLYQSPLDPAGSCPYSSQGPTPCCRSFQDFWLRATLVLGDGPRSLNGQNTK